MSDCKSFTKTFLQNYLRDMKKKKGTKVKLTGSKDELCKQYLKLKEDSALKSLESPQTSPNAYGNSWEALSVKTNYSPITDKKTKENKDNIEEQMKILIKIQEYLKNNIPSAYEIKTFQKLLNYELNKYIDKYEKSPPKKKHMNKDEIAELIKNKTDMKKIILELKKIPNGHLDREWIGIDAIQDTTKEWLKNYSNEDKRKYLKVIGRDDLSPTKDWL